VIDAEVLRGIQCRHLNRLYRVEAKLDRSVDVVADVSLAKDIGGVFVVRAEHKIPRIYSVFDHTPNQIVEIPLAR
jgi:hypothetical protein